MHCRIWFTPRNNGLFLFSLLGVTLNFPESLPERLDDTSMMLTLTHLRFRFKLLVQLTVEKADFGFVLWHEFNMVFIDHKCLTCQSQGLPISLCRHRISIRRGRDL
jgi:hypothetical protein